jgi:hypothetical protein
MFEPGAWILRSGFPKVPCQVVRVIPYPGTPSGFLVEHNGAGIPILAGDQVTPCPDEMIPLVRRSAMPLKKPNPKPAAQPRKTNPLPAGMNLFGVLE